MANKKSCLNHLGNKNSSKPEIVANKNTTQPTKMFNLDQSYYLVRKNIVQNSKIKEKKGKIAYYGNFVEQYGLCNNNLDKKRLLLPPPSILNCDKNKEKTIQNTSPFNKNSDKVCNSEEKEIEGLERKIKEMKRELLILRYKNKRFYQ